MTKYVENVKRDCKTCASYQGGVCSMSMSDHFGHALAYYHPACSEYIR